jgi:hypothetical protein
VEEEERRKIEPEEVIFNDFSGNKGRLFSFILQGHPSTNHPRTIPKTKFYTNPIYHLLLRVDIDAFLSRQPLSHSLTIEEEIDLFDDVRFLPTTTLASTILSNYKGKKGKMVSITSPLVKPTVWHHLRLASPK